MTDANDAIPLRQILNRIINIGQQDCQQQSEEKKQKSAQQALLTLCLAFAVYFGDRGISFQTVNTFLTNAADGLDGLAAVMPEILPDLSEPERSMSFQLDQSIPDLSTDRTQQSFQAKRLILFFYRMSRSPWGTGILLGILQAMKTCLSPVSDLAGT
jgi:hypothetical protein